MEVCFPRTTCGPQQTRLGLFQGWALRALVDESFACRPWLPLPSRRSQADLRCRDGWLSELIQKSGCLGAHVLQKKSRGKIWGGAFTKPKPQSALLCLSSWSDNSTRPNDMKSLLTCGHSTLWLTSIHLPLLSASGSGSHQAKRKFTKPRKEKPSS